MNPDTEGSGRLSPKATAMTELARQSLGSMSDKDSARELSVLHERLERRFARRGSTRWVPATVAVALVVALVAGSRLRLWSGGHGALAYDIDGAVLERDGVLRSTATAPLLHFSDGTAVSLGVATQARMTSVDARGARFRLDDGELRVHVMPRANSRWVFDAGPFEVTVTGTAFSMAWSESAGRLDVRMQRGAVTVHGPLSQDPITVRAGQQLTLKLNEREVVIRNGDGVAEQNGTMDPEAHGSSAAQDRRTSPPDETPAAAATAVTAASRVTSPQLLRTPQRRQVAMRAAIRDSGATSGVAAQPEREAPAPATPSALPAPSMPPAPSVPSSPASSVWASLLVAGELESILDEADRSGVDVCLRERDSADLAALADAARYKGRVDVARRALLVQMQRFPGTPRAKDAAFQIGRLEESAGAAQRALGWYDRYLEESPRGTFASEALGRKMGVLQQLYGIDAARPVAERYLQQFPEGSYARAARALTRAE